MNKPTSPVILAIGAHVGDMELTAGGTFIYLCNTKLDSGYYFLNYK